MKKIILLIIFFILFIIFYTLFVPVKLYKRENFVYKNHFNIRSEFKKGDINGYFFNDKECGYFSLNNGMIFYYNAGEDEYIQANKKGFIVYKKYGNRVTTPPAAPLRNAKKWLMMMNALKKKEPPLPGGGYLSGCSRIAWMIVVRADGVIVPCSQMPHIELGVINKDDLGSIWLEHPELKRLRERRNISLSSFEFCRGCEFMNYCTGGCPAIAYTTIGTDEHPDPHSCLRKFLEEGGRLPDEGLL
ncbi:MAG: SPASM domain-containing protein [Candidatus Omnitrophica bacterium]|nr:SPASM domain-containing protein [Candidatus Omnitrophota bacterium]